MLWPLQDSASQEMNKTWLQILNLYYWICISRIQDAVTLKCEHGVNIYLVFPVIGNRKKKKVKNSQIKSYFLENVYKNPA